MDIQCHVDCLIVDVEKIAAAITIVTAWVPPENMCYNYRSTIITVVHHCLGSLNILLNWAT